MKKQRGVPGDRGSIARRDSDRQQYQDRQQKRRDRAHQRSGVFGYGMLANQRRQTEERD